LDLVVFNDNTRAIRLYRKLGFQMNAIPGLEAQLESERTPSGRRRVVMRKRLKGGA
jgi:ribosomal protein S18 acetylase RimI-like enzyme